MRIWTIGLVLAAGAVLLLGCSSTITRPPAAQDDPRQRESPRVRAVLVAGDSSLRVFDNGVVGLASWLRNRAGVAPQQIVRLSAAPAVIAHDGVQAATVSDVMTAIENMQPGEGQGCLVFMTSHGLRGEGVELNASGVLGPVELDRALTKGCHDAPTVAIISACFSGNFVRAPMARANRIVLTAARSDRSSFGCGASETYTFFDQCLLESLDRAKLWRELFKTVRACVAERESRGGFIPSQPQGWFGAAVAKMLLPGASG